jgi:ATP-dependent NAD(P)H-hydrate dehydratase
MRCAEHGSPRRCGGQGDVLAGTTGVFAAWAVAATQREGGGEADLQLAAYAACLVTRQAAALAFAARKRSMVAGDLLQELGAVIERLAPCGTPD